MTIEAIRLAAEAHAAATDEQGRIEKLHADARKVSHEAEERLRKLCSELINETLGEHYEARIVLYVHRKKQ